ncbi:MAG TPA: FxLYD domain-containing protein [Clostridia bacterium]|nr:FxLYD domain-containing protein [Clostridia bacterium]
MNRKFLEGDCTECGKRLKYPAEIIGTVTKCPYCGKQTELLLAEPEHQSTVPRKAIIWTAIGIIILSGGLVGSMIALKKAQRWASKKEPSHSAAATTVPAPSQAIATPGQIDGFAFSTVIFEKLPAGTYAVGSATNLLNRPRLKVSVELELLDASGAKNGVAMDSTPRIEPGAAWRFRARVLVPAAVRATVGAFREEQ